ncbi:MAG: HAD-IB family hydrolase [Acidimicrobiales bacterium]|nr:HAD-IB family hydrolase [Acidimicrobiales bacterium]
MSGRRIAAFDFDGTLTRRDTLVPFLATACGRGALGRALRRVGPLAVRARTGRLDSDLHHRDATKAALLHELMAGREAAWLERQGSGYAAGLGARLRPEMVEQVAWHREAGHELVLVSASLGTYLRPFAERHGFDHVIAVELEIGDHGRLTGAMAGPNVRGPEKASRLREWLSGDPVQTMWAYGNSSGDRELLAMADVPVWVQRPARRATAARP